MEYLINFLCFIKMKRKVDISFDSAITLVVFEELRNSVFNFFFLFMSAIKIQLCYCYVRLDTRTVDNNITHFVALTIS